jgi:hypothetical protein
MDSNDYPVVALTVVAAPLALAFDVAGEFSKTCVALKPQRLTPRAAKGN